MCQIEDGDRFDVFTETLRKARKTHKCDCCKGNIAIGARYLVHFSVYEGEPSSQKMCAPCNSDRHKFADAHGGSLAQPLYFPEMLDECILDGDKESEQMWKPMLEAIAGRGQ